ncbi:MAG: AraC family transcriptional regulator [Solirubrobacteraceae bacterium]
MEARGILRPEAVGRQFELQRLPPPADLEPMIEHHWLVSWNLPGCYEYSSEVLPHPSVHLVFEPTGAAVYGVSRSRYVRRLSGNGWALGTKFHPGGFRPFVAGPLSALTDRVLELGELFGTDGTRLEQQCLALPRPVDALAHVQRFLRARLPASTCDDPNLALVRELATSMALAPPGARVADIAGAHGVSVRTVQRLFSEYVGIGPKWVLQRYRLHEALAQLHAGPDTDWARFALGLGYYDQAHFIRDFRALVGRTPAQYKRERRHSDHFSKLPRR